jgi:uncharacterized protein YkwD
VQRGALSISAFAATTLVVFSLAGTAAATAKPKPVRSNAVVRSVVAPIGSSGMRRLAPSLPRWSGAAVANTRPGRRRLAVSLTSLASGVLGSLNSVRRSRGLRPLRLSHALSLAAKEHSLQMVQRGFFEHESPNGAPFWRRIERFYGSRGFRFWEVGENLAYGSPELGADETVRMWMNSPGHRENLLVPRWREVGLAAVHVGSAPGTFGGSAVTVITADFGIRLK